MLVWLISSLVAASIGADTVASLPILPNGYEMVAYVDCGESQPDDPHDGPRIRQTAGTDLRFDGVDGPLGTASVADDRVEFEFARLDAGAEYVLGFTWWDVDAQGRWQSVHFGTTVVLPATPALANYEGKSTFSRILLPVPASYVKDESLRVAFAREQGPNVVVNEMWLLRKTSPEARKRVLIVTGDDYPGHLWRQTAPELAAIVREDSRLEVTITESPGILASPLLSHYDAVMIHFKDYPEHMVVGESVWSGLQQFVDSGKGIVLVHFGCGAFQGWDGFVNVAGRVWDPEKRAHDPYGPFQVNVIDTEHPITSSMESFGVTDELYTCLEGTSTIRVLCQATSKVDQQKYPMGFVAESTTGRVFHCTLGHDVAALGSEGARRLYRHAVAWAAGLDPDGK
jgi:type 1 glutamine amidotransferase